MIHMDGRADARVHGFLNHEEYIVHASMKGMLFCSTADGIHIIHDLLHQSDTCKTTIDNTASAW